MMTGSLIMYGKYNPWTKEERFTLGISFDLAMAGTVTSCVVTFLTTCAFMPFKWDTAVNPIDDNELVRIDGLEERIESSCHDNINEEIIKECFVPSWKYKMSTSFPGLFTSTSDSQL